MSMPPKYVPTAFSLESYTPVPECGCWIWTGAWGQTGYGRVGARQRNKSPRKEGPLAHRMFYEYHVGPIPEGMLVMHKCDTPVCVNPAHLTLGTAADNSADKIAKGRAKSERKPPIPPEIVQIILARSMSRRELWDRYKISSDRVKNLRKKHRQLRERPISKEGQQ